MKNELCNFHNTKMTIKVLTSETDNRYSVIHFEHPSNVGPALHFHPSGPEVFHIIRGHYTFFINGKNVDAKAGDIVLVPKGIPHKFNSGNMGGEFLVTSPPNLENYFYETSQLSSVSWKIESKIAKKYGQIFLENTNHWKPIT